MLDAIDGRPSLSVYPKLSFRNKTSSSPRSVACDLSSTGSWEGLGLTDIWVNAQVLSLNAGADFFVQFPHFFLTVAARCRTLCSVQWR